MHKTPFRYTELLRHKGLIRAAIDHLRKQKRTLSWQYGCRRLLDCRRVTYQIDTTGAITFHQARTQSAVAKGQGKALPFSLFQDSQGDLWLLEPPHHHGFNYVAQALRVREFQGTIQLDRDSGCRFKICDLSMQALACDVMMQFSEPASAKARESLQDLQDELFITHQKSIAQSVERVSYQDESLARLTARELVMIKNPNLSHKTMREFFDFDRKQSEIPYLSLMQCQSLLGDLFDGVKALHDRGFVHREIKPDNIIITDDKAMTAALSDFTLARLLSEGESEILVSANNLISHYCAPESISCDARGYYHTSMKSDIYSLGKVMQKLFERVQVGQAKLSARQRQTLLRLKRLASVMQSTNPVERPTIEQCIARVYRAFYPKRYPALYNKLRKQTKLSRFALEMQTGEEAHALLSVYQMYWTRYLSMEGSSIELEATLIPTVYERATGPLDERLAQASYDLKRMSEQRQLMSRGAMPWRRFFNKLAGKRVVRRVAA